ncbi:MAG: hypothetical protein ABR577_20065 [Pyrinomonadaceae bacterium]
MYGTEFTICARRKWIELYATTTIGKILNRHGLNRLRTGRTPREPKLYSRDVPGERVQMDTVKIASGLFPFIALDDCTRMRVLALYPRRTAHNAVRFLKEYVGRVPVSYPAYPDKSWR